jgi:hypothetical protein
VGIATTGDHEMALSVFDDKGAEPDEKALAAVLGKTCSLWEKICAYLAREFDPIDREWNFPGKKYGWSLRIKHRKRTILYLTPLDGCFRVAFVFGERAVAVVEGSSVPEEIKEELRNARKYAEGRGLALEIKAAKDLKTIKQLAAIKMAN